MRRCCKKAHDSGDVPSARAQYALIWKEIRQPRRLCVQWHEIFCNLRFILARRADSTRLAVCVRSPLSALAQLSSRISRARIINLLGRDEKIHPGGGGGAGCTRVMYAKASAASAARVSVLWFWTPAGPEMENKIEPHSLSVRRPVYCYTRICIICMARWWPRDQRQRRCQRLHETQIAKQAKYWLISWMPNANAARRWWKKKIREICLHRFCVWFCAAPVPFPSLCRVCDQKAARDWGLWWSFDFACLQSGTEGMCATGTHGVLWQMFQQKTRIVKLSISLMVLKHCAEFKLTDIVTGSCVFSTMMFFLQDNVFVLSINY